MNIPNNDVTIHKIFFEHCRTGIRAAMQLVATKESLNAGDIQALRILGGVYEAMLGPDLEKCTQILADVHNNGLLAMK